MPNKPPSYIVLTIIFLLLFFNHVKTSNNWKRITYETYEKGHNPHKLFLDAMKKSQKIKLGGIYLIFDNKSSNIGHWISGDSSSGMDYFFCLEDKSKILLDSIVELKKDTDIDGVFSNQTVRNLLMFSNGNHIGIFDDLSRIHMECSGNVNGGDTINSFFDKIFGSSCPSGSCGGKKWGEKLSKNERKNIVEKMTNSQYRTLCVMFFLIMIPQIFFSWLFCCYFRCFTCCCWRD